MIFVSYPEESAEAGEWVYAAFRRSFSEAQLERGTGNSAKNTPLFIVFVNPSDEIFPVFQAACTHPAGAKILLLGKIPLSVAKQLGMNTRSITEDMSSAALSEPAPIGSFRESSLRVRYQRSLGPLASPTLERPFARYDFANEWNHLGYGAIRVDGSPWALSQIADVPPLQF